ncbi:MAG: hypothetical protein ACTSU3_11555 [Candidatus Thorarchaeota archaeon]
MDISVKIYFPSGEVSRGVLTFTIDGPKLALEGESEVLPEDERIHISVIKELSNDNLLFKSGVRFEYNTESAIRKYSTKPKLIQEIYPPSTKGWLAHLSESGKDAIYSLQKIIDDDRYLLSIVDLQSGEVLRVHPVQAFEINMLLMATDWMIYNEIFEGNIEDYEEIPLQQVLDSFAPPWSDLGPLLDGVNIPDLKRGSTMKETMEQLVPRSFGEDVRLQLMAFLAYTINLQVPKDDPLNFQKAMNRRFKSAPLLRRLVYGHIQSLLEGIKPPQYVRIMTMADRGLLKTGIEPSPTETDPWTVSWHKIMEMFPNNNERVAKVAQELNQTKEIITKLPISKEDAKKSSIAWNNRFSLIRAGFMMRSHVQEQKLGLSKLVFLGRTNRWPHKHLAWSARLGNPEHNPPYIQVMVMPKNAIAKLDRLGQKTALVRWSAARVNYRLYKPKKDDWRINLTQIMNSFSRSRTLSSLNKEYTLSKNAEIRIPNEAEAKVIDLASFGMDLSSLEVGSYDVLQMSNDSLKKILQSFQEQGIINLQYFSYLSGLVSICLEIKGELGKLYSIARGLLKHLPSAKILISEEKGVCYLLGRVPEKSAYEILTEFPTKAAQHNIELKGYRVTAYVDYLHNLHQRLLTSEGTWDDDISGLLSQIRS